MHPDGAALLSRFAGDAEAAAAELGALFLPQPASTRVGPVFTPDALRRGAVRMKPTGDTPFEDTDVGHMGPDYGTAVLAAVAEALA